MSGHLTPSDWKRVADHTLDAERLRDIAKHLESCAECGTEAENMIGSNALFITDDGDFAHLETEQIADLMAGRLSPADLEIAQSHLEDCDGCRQMVDDLRQPARRVRPRPFMVAVAATAAAAAIVIAVVSLDRPRPPAASPTPRPVVVQPLKSEWKRYVDEAVRSRTLATPPALRDLNPDPRFLRGTATQSEISLSPRGIIVRSTRPDFTWPAVAGATYVVLLQESGSNDVLQSPRLHQTSWQPARDLVRGSVYEWQVSVDRDHASSIVPAPPAPRALFRVLDAATERDLAEAELRHPGDHLLLSVLYSRAGLVADAISETEKMRADPQNSALASAFLSTLRDPR
jgi:hypothetical protein